MIDIYARKLLENSIITMKNTPILSIEKAWL